MKGLKTHFLQKFGQFFFWSNFIKVQTICITIDDFIGDVFILYLFNALPVFSDNPHFLIRVRPPLPTRIFDIHTFFYSIIKLLNNLLSYIPKSRSKAEYLMNQNKYTDPFINCCIQKQQQFVHNLNNFVHQNYLKIIIIVS